MKVVIVGAGMSGLSLGMMLARKGIEIRVLEQADYIGGAAHSFPWNGHTCDWAAHRLFTRDEHILQQIQSLVPLNRLERTSAVHLGGRWLRDPVDVVQICTRFFPRHTFSVPASYLARPRGLPETSFQNYVYARFGRALGDFLFSPYTEKMFGIPASEISVEWARKKVRIAGPLDVIRQGSKKKFSYFYYPKQGGYGSIPNRLHAEIADRVTTGATVTGFRTEGDRVAAVRYRQDGVEREETADVFVSTMPMTELCGMLGFDTPLAYRAVSAVYVLVNRPHTSPNHWIYYMDGGVAVNRLCEVKNMDPAIGPAETSVVCAEVTAEERPGFADRAVADLAASGLFRMDEVLDTTVVRRDHAYPVYRCDYERDVDAAQAFLSRYRNLHWVGRAAQFEHLEVDDCFANALQLARELTAEDERPAEVAAPSRSDLPIEPLVACAVVESGEGAEALEALASLDASDYRQVRPLLVSASAELRTEASRRFPGAEVLALPEGAGVPAAFNLACHAARRAGAEFAFLALGRARAEPETIRHLVATAQRDPEAAVLAPKILSAEHPDRIWSIGIRFRRFPPSTVNIGAGQRDDGRFAETREVEFAVSCGLLVKLEAMEKVGLFDPGYRYYYEDIDFSRRVRTEGFRVRFVPEARLHYREPPAEERDDAFYATWGESFARYYRRHMRPLGVVLPVHLCYLALREAFSGRAARVPALLRGVGRGLRSSLGPIPRLDAEFLAAPSDAPPADTSG